MHPATQAILKHFDSSDAAFGSENVHRILSRIEDLAQSAADLLPDDPEKTAGLRKLLEARDCFERAGKGA